MNVIRFTVELNQFAVPFLAESRQNLVQPIEHFTRECFAAVLGC
jgi:hypothetical protein